MAAVPEGQERRRASAAIDVAAAICDGMRRQFEHPEIEQVDRLRFPAGTSSVLRGVST
jgi:hypothetical protein